MASETLYELASAGQTTTFNSPDLSWDDFTHLGVVGRVTAVAGTSPTLVVSVQKKTPAGNYVTVLASASINAAADILLSVGPGCTPVANRTSPDLLGNIGRVLFTIGGSAGQTVTFDCSVVGERTTF